MAEPRKPQQPEEDEAVKQERRVRAAFRQLHRYEAGKVVLKYLDDNFVFTSPYIKGDPAGTQVNVGKQWLALLIRDLADTTNREE